MGSCEAEDDSTTGASPMVGVGLTLVACCCYAFGNCMQRYSLLKAPGEKVFGVLHRQAGWLVGAIVYFSANGIYAVALSYAPVSMLAAVFSLTIVANACCARLLLGDTVPPLAYPGYFMVLAGSCVFSLSLDAKVCHFDGNELVEVMTSWLAMPCWIVLGSLVFGGLAFARFYERRYPLKPDAESEQKDAGVMEATDEYVAEQSPREDHRRNHLANLHDDEDDDNEEEHAVPPSKLLYLMARFLYPSSLGATEAAGALILKALNSLMTSIATEEDEAADENSKVDKDFPGDLPLWIGLFVAGTGLCLLIVVWLRLVYSRFEITGAFPVEFGMLTLASVIGGFLVFEDHEYVETSEAWTGVTLAGTLIMAGIAVVGYFSFVAAQQARDAQAEAQS